MDIPYIEASGTDYEIGCAIGETLKGKLHQADETLRTLLTELGQKALADRRGFVRSSQSLIKKHFPRYLDELRGMASGSGLRLGDVILLCCEEEFRAAAAKSEEKCTTFAVSCADGVFLCHNEDWYPSYENLMYVVKATPKKGAAYLSLAYVGAPAGSSVALNSHGIAFSGNALFDFMGVQRGMPKNLILRSELEARSLDDYVRLASFSPRAIPAHRMAADRNGGIVSVELSFDRASVVRSTGYYVHTNHAIHPTMEALQTTPPGRTSVPRYLSVQSLLEKESHTKDLMRRILLCHDNYPDSVCRHANNVPGEGQTIGSALVDLNEMSMEVCLGTPCSSEYVTYRL